MQYCLICALDDHEFVKKLLQQPPEKKVEDMLAVCNTHITHDANLSVMSLGTAKTVSAVQCQGTCHNTTSVTKQASAQYRVPAATVQMSMAETPAQLVKWYAKEQDAPGTGKLDSDYQSRLVSHHDLKRI